MKNFNFLQTWIKKCQTDIQLKQNLFFVSFTKRLSSQYNLHQLQIEQLKMTFCCLQFRINRHSKSRAQKTFTVWSQFLHACKSVLTLVSVGELLLIDIEEFPFDSGIERWLVSVPLTLVYLTGKEARNVLSNFIYATRYYGAKVDVIHKQILQFLNVYQLSIRAQKSNMHGITRCICEVLYNI